MPQVWRHRALRVACPSGDGGKKGGGKSGKSGGRQQFQKGGPKGQQQYPQQGKGPHRENAQREKIGQRMGVGRVAGRISVTSARRDNLATKVERDTLESDRLEVYNQRVRV